MTRDDITRWARDAGMHANCGHTDKDGTHSPAINALKSDVPVEWLERFAALVAAAEREACAQVCADWSADTKLSNRRRCDADILAHTIRARGN